MDNIKESEAVATNSIGGAGGEAIKLFDPLLVGMMKRKDSKPKKLRDILKQEINQDKRYGV